MARFLVTGGCGFIGSHLTDALIGGGNEVHTLDDLSTGSRDNLNPAATLSVGSIADPTALAAALKGSDGVFHLAAIASVAKCNEEWVPSHRVNLTASIELFELAATASIPVVYASSAAVYGDQTAVPLSESSVPLPRSAYGADKLGCELHARAGAAVHGLSSVGLRFFNVFGTRQPAGSPYSGVITIFADRLAKALPIALHGDGSQTRDFIHVSDVVRGLERSMTWLQSRQAGSEAVAAVANLCTGRETSIAELAAAMQQLAGDAQPIEHLPTRAGDIHRSLGDPGTAEALFGFKAATPLAAGLKDLID